MKRPSTDNPFATEERANLRVPRPESRDTFWRRFEARAEAPAPAPAPRWRVLLPAWPPPLVQGLAAACLLLALTLGGLYWSLRPAMPDAGSRIRFLTIDTAHDGLFILEDAGQQAVVVWIDERRS